MASITSDMTVPKETVVGGGIALALVKIGIGAAALVNQSCLGEPLIPIWLVGE